MKKNPLSDFDQKRLKRIGAWLRIARENLRFSFRDLARIADVPHSQIARIEAGDVEFSVIKFLRLAEALGISSGVFLESMMFPYCPRDEDYEGDLEQLERAIQEALGKSEFESLFTQDFGSFVQGIAEVLIALALSANPKELSRHFSHEFDDIDWRIEEFADGYDFQNLTHYERAAFIKALSESPYGKLRSLQLIDDDLIRKYHQWREDNGGYCGSFENMWAGNHMRQNFDIPIERSNKSIIRGKISVYKEKAGEYKVPLTGTGVEKWEALKERLANATQVRGSKTALAAELGISRQLLNSWINGSVSPTAGNTLFLAEWVTEEESQQKESLTSAVTPARPRTQESKSTNEKPNSSSKRTYKKRGN